VFVIGAVKPPVTGLITSPFGYRDHPVTEEEDFHTGMDIAAVEGRAILCALPGTVTEVGQSPIYGNFITVRHSENLETFYAHCSEIIATAGTKVRQGERIAKVGQTGVATGSHLHFSVLVAGQYCNPYWLLKDDVKLLDA
jgi:murein DD-endopeptidase MepM/ murein hydrolase activator NlpD